MAERPTANVDLSWEGGQRFTSSDRYGHRITLDAPVSDGDAFEGFKPSELLLASLAGCSGMDVVNILRKQRQEVTAMDIRVKGVQRPDPPWPWVELHLEYVVRGRGLKASAVEQAIRLSETKYCSVAATLGADTRITSTFQIVDEGEASPRKDP